MESAEVCLVSMPYASLPRPSLALGLLKGILERDGIKTVVAHANLWFAEFVGLDLYRVCATQTPTEYLAGEWTFAAAAFPGSVEHRDQEYLRHVGDIRGRRGQGVDADQLVHDLCTLRGAAEEFIDEAARRILRTGARIVGCTSTFEQHTASLALLRRIRELAPEVITMLGGGNCETDMGAATHRNFPWVDYVVSGEADGLITGLCRTVLDKGREVTADMLPRGVLGPCHNRDPQRRSLPVPRALYRDLDSLPSPSFEDYFETLAASSFRDFIRPGLPLETSRGCWWGDTHQCTFCGLNGSSMAFRSKSPDRVLTEIRELEERHGIGDFEVVENIFDMAYFKTVLPALAADGRSRQLCYEVKANVRREQVQALVRSGVTWVQPGIESLHTDVLKLMDKGVRGWQNIQLLKWARELGLRLSWSLLWGFPGEQDDWYRQMAEWVPQLEHLQAPGALAHLRYDRYSVYHQRAKEMGLVLFPIRAMSYVYPLPASELSDLTYFFTPEAGPGPLDVAVGSRGGLEQRRPGVFALRQAMERWRDAFEAKVRPVLAMTDRDDGLHILDSRSCAVRPRQILTGVVRAVALVCDGAPRADRIAEVVQRDWDPSAYASDVATAVRTLVEAGLVLPVDGRLVGLAVQDSHPALPAGTHFPGGFVDHHAAREAGVSGAVRC